MSSSTFDGIRRGETWHFDPLTEVCIVTPVKEKDAGPLDVVDPNHAYCEKQHRDFTRSDVADMHHIGQLQTIAIAKNGDKCAIPVDGRRRVRIIRAVNVERDLFNSGEESWLVTAPPMFKMKNPDKSGEYMPEGKWAPMRVRGELHQGDAKAAFRAQLSANTHRAGYTPVQLAHQLAEYRQLGADDEALLEAAAGLVPDGRKPMEWVREILSLNDTAPEVQAAVEKKEISTGTAAELSGLSREEQKTVINSAPVVAGKRQLTKVKVKDIKRAKRGVKATPKLRKPDEIKLAHALLADWLGGDATEHGRKKMPDGVRREEIRPFLTVLAWLRGRDGGEDMQEALDLLTDADAPEEKAGKKDKAA